MSTAKESKLLWPQVNISQVDVSWWEKVMRTSVLLEPKFSRALDDSADFTIRGIVHVILTKMRDEVEWYLQGAMELGRILVIYDLVHGEKEEDRKRGYEELLKLISDYTTDISNLDSLSKNTE